MEEDDVKARAMSHVDGCFVHAAPWDDWMEFPSPREARKYARRHAREIASNWDY